MLKILARAFLKIQVFWDVTPWRLVNSYRRFEMSMFPHLPTVQEGLDYRQGYVGPT